ncbi:hypothetical protein ACIBAG_33065 [Streptomyces sp. NPDC051243]|uniref:hypothetical protein n=1 Tax=Streptomyces sp. NPDC051243 TaxID=3365646 RepID=UPI00379B7435
MVAVVEQHCLVGRPRKRSSGAYDVTARRGILPATGSYPRVLPVLGSDGRRVMTGGDGGRPSDSGDLLVAVGR